MVLMKQQNLYRDSMATTEATIFTTACLRTARAQEEIRRRHCLQRRPDPSASIGQSLGSDLEYCKLHRTVLGQTTAGC